MKESRSSGLRVALAQTAVGTVVLAFVYGLAALAVWAFDPSAPFSALRPVSWLVAGLILAVTVGTLGLIVIATVRAIGEDLIDALRPRLAKPGWAAPATGPSTTDAAQPGRN